jgi:hypothetical protein
VAITELSTLTLGAIVKPAGIAMNTKGQIVRAISNRERNALNTVGFVPNFLIWRRNFMSGRTERSRAVAGN